MSSAEKELDALMARGAFPHLKKSILRALEAHLRPPARASLPRIRFAVLRALQTQGLPADRAKIRTACEPLNFCRQFDCNRVATIALEATRNSGAGLAELEAANFRLKQKGVER